MAEKNEKKCSKCGEMKNLSEYHLHEPKKSKTRRRPDCKECRKIQNREYYLRKKMEKLNKKSSKE